MNLIEPFQIYFQDFQTLGSKLAYALFKERLSNKDLRYACESLVIASRHLAVDDSFLRISQITKLPDIIEPHNFFRLLNSKPNWNFTMHIQKIESSKIIKKIKLRISVLQSELNWRSLKGKNADEMVCKEKALLEQMLDRMVNHNDDVFKASFYFSKQSIVFDKLVSKHSELKRVGEALDYQVDTCAFAQYQALRSLLPMGEDLIKREHTILSSNLLSLLPFHTEDQIEDKGIFLGFDKLGGGIFIKDLLSGSNMNINIFGTSGSGKSVTAKLLISRLKLRAIRMLVIDPEGEYETLCSNDNGIVFKISEQEGIDPVLLVDSLPCSINHKVEILTSFLSSLYDNSIAGKLAMARIIKRVMVSKSDRSFRGLVSKLIKLDDLKFLSELISGSVSPLFRGNRVIDINAQLICFDLSGIYAEGLKQSIVLLIAQAIKILLYDNNHKTLIFIDESHKLLSNPSIRDFYIDLVKTARKRKAGVVSITQNPEDMKEQDGSRIIISQAEHTFLLRHASASLNYIKRYALFDLSAEDYENIAQLDRGSALLLSPPHHYYIDIFPFESERHLVFS